MIEIPFITGEVLFTAVWFAVRIIICIARQSVDWRHEARLLLMYINLAVIIRFTFFPFSLVDGHVQPLVFEPAAIFPPRVNLIPLDHLFWFETTKDLLTNIIGNVALFIPTGIILPIIWKGLDRWWKAIPTGMLISLIIELAQLPFASRATDIDDLILNSLGVIIGYIIYAEARAVRRRDEPSRGRHLRT